MYKRAWSSKNIIRLGIGLIFLIIIGFIWLSGLHKCLTFEQVKSNTVWLSEQATHHYWWTVFFYIGIYITVVICSLPGAALMSVIGGFLFGVLSAAIYINIAATIGATIFFILVRYLIGGYLQVRYAQKLVHFNQMIEKKGWLFLIMIRCIPLIPFFMVNMFAGLTRIPFSTFIWTTMVGVIPTSILFAFAGRELGMISKFTDIFSVPILCAMALLILLVLIPFVINKHRRIF